MSSCTRATNATWNRVITATATTILIRYFEPQLQTVPFTTVLWNVGKGLIKNDKQALPDAIKALRCWLGI